VPYFFIINCAPHVLQIKVLISRPLDGLQFNIPYVYIYAYTLVLVYTTVTVPANSITLFVPYLDLDLAAFTVHFDVTSTIARASHQTWVQPHKC